MFYRINDPNPDPGSLSGRLRALPMFDPPPGGWARLEARRRAVRRRFAFAGGGLALAASVLVAVGMVSVRPDRTPQSTVSPQLADLISRSQMLEQRLVSARPQLVVWNGQRAERAAMLESQLAQVDSQLNYAGASSSEQLWRERVRLMNALVDLHKPEAPALQYASYQY